MLCTDVRHYTFGPYNKSSVVNSKSSVHDYSSCKCTVNSNFISHLTQELAAANDQRVQAEARLESLRSQVKLARDSEQQARREADAVREQLHSQQLLATSLQQLQVWHL